MNLKDSLKEIASGTNNEAIVANFLLNYKGDFRKLKAQDIMNECFVSLATVTRLSKSAGLHGFNELKIYLYQENEILVSENKKYQGKDILDYYTDLSLSLKQTFDMIDEQLLNNVVDIIISSENINIHAMGGTNYVTADLYNKLIRLNLKVTNFADYHTQTVVAKNSSKKTASLGVSYSGKTIEVLDSLNLSKQAGACTILLTSDKNINYDFIDFVVVLPCSDSLFRSSSLTSRINILAILDIIYIKILNSNYDNYMEILEKTKFY